MIFNFLYFIQFVILQSIVKNGDKEYDEIWCVFDMDVQKGQKEFSDFDSAIDKGLNTLLI